MGLVPWGGLPGVDGQHTGMGSGMNGQYRDRENRDRLVRDEWTSTLQEKMGCTGNTFEEMVSERQEQG